MPSELKVGSVRWFGERCGGRDEVSGLWSLLFRLVSPFELRLVASGLSSELGRGRQVVLTTAEPTASLWSGTSWSGRRQTRFRRTVYGEGGAQFLRDAGVSRELIKALGR